MVTKNAVYKELSYIIFGYKLKGNFFKIKFHNSSGVGKLLVGII